MLRPKTDPHAEHRSSRPGRNAIHRLLRGRRRLRTVAIRVDDRAIAQVLKKAGYATGGFGKVGVGGTQHPTGVGRILNALLERELDKRLAALYHEWQRRS